MKLYKLSSSEIEEKKYHILDISNFSMVEFRLSGVIICIKSSMFDITTRADRLYTTHRLLTIYSHKEVSGFEVIGLLRNTDDYDRLQCINLYAYYDDKSIPLKYKLSN